MEDITREHGVPDLQFASQSIPLVHAHPLNGFSELHLLYLTSYAHDHLLRLVEAVTRERVIFIQFIS